MGVFLIGFIFFSTELLHEKVVVHSSLNNNIEKDEREMDDEDECEHGIENLSQIDQFDKLDILCSKIQKRNDQKHFQPFSEIKVNPDVFPFVGLAIDSDAEINGMNAGHSNDRRDRIRVQQSDHHGQ